MCFDEPVGIIMDWDRYSESKVLIKLKNREFSVYRTVDLIVAKE